MAHANGHANKSVAIIGGGMAGLMCAVKLRQLGVSGLRGRGHTHCAHAIMQSTITD